VDLDTAGDVWFFRPPADKNTWRGRQTEVPIGPLGQDVLRPYLRPDPRAYLFRPAPRRPGERYRVSSYRRAVTRACRAAGVAVWTPHQLRHSFASRMLDALGVEELPATAAALGHASLDVTMIYTHLRRERAADLARRIG